MFRKVFYHAVEFLVVLVAALLILQVFGVYVTDDSKVLIVSTVMAAFAKLGRETFGDYVNE